MRPPQTDERYTKNLGERDAKVALILRENYSDLLKVWAFYSALYEKDLRTVEVLNAASRQSFGLIQCELRNSLIVRIFNFDDTNKEVASLRTVKKMGLCTDAIKQLIEQAASAVEPIRIWRNNFTAHVNTAHAIQERVPLNIKLDGDAFQAAIDSIGRVVKAVHFECCKIELIFQSSNDKFATELIGVLQMGLAGLQKEQE